MAPLQFLLSLALFSTLLVIRLISAQFVPFSREGLALDSSDPFGSDDSSGQLDTVVCGIQCEDNCKRMYLLTPVTLDATSQYEGARIHAGTIGRGERRSAKCGQNQAVSEARCDRNCERITVSCRRLKQYWKNNPNRRKTFRFFKHRLARTRVRARRIGAVEAAPEGGRGAERVVRPFADERWECEDKYYLWGLECIGEDCDEILFICALVLVHNRITSLGPGDSPTGSSRGSALCRNLLNPDPVSQRTSTFGANDISEVAPGPVCGVKCYGRYCNEKRLLYVGGVNILRTVEYWTDWFTSGAVGRCPEGMVVSQVECSGAFCRWISLGCQSVGPNIEIGEPVFHRDPGGDDVIWCQGHEYLTGISCRGWSCTYIDLWCNELQCA